MRLRHLAAAIIVMSATTIVVPAAQGVNPKWEDVTPASGQGVVNGNAQTAGIAGEQTEQELEIGVREGYIYIRSESPVVVKLFTILGQQILQESVPAGYHRLRVPSRGIYILRAGTVTRRITI